jgi:hypothetical protein
MIQLTQLCKTMDSELMQDFGPYLKEDLTECIVTKLSHLMKSPTVMKKKTSRIKARMIQVTQLCKTMDSEQMLDCGPSIKEKLSQMLRRNTITEINTESHLMR